MDLPGQTPGGAAPESPDKEKWFVPFVVIPLGIALAILSIVGLANFLLGRGGPRTLDELLSDIRGGGANARKQAAFHLARNIAEEVNRTQTAAPVPEAAPQQRAAWPRRELQKIEAAYDSVKDDIETRRFLVSALGLVGDDATVAFLGNQIAAPDASDTEGTLHIAELHAIARICSESALPIFDAELDRALAKERDPGILNILASGYGNLQTPAATERLLKILQIARDGAPEVSRDASGARKTTWREVRWTAAVNLAKRKTVDPEKSKLAIPVLVEGLRDVHDDAFRPEGERLFRGAGNSGGFLPAGVTSQADGMREDAARLLIVSLQYLGAGEAVEILQKVSTKDPNLKIRSAALEALKALAPAGK